MSSLADEGEIADDFDMGDERTYYQPRYFRKVVKSNPDGSKDYRYEPAVEQYWTAREKGDWRCAPRIYDDDCEPFY